MESFLGLGISSSESVRPLTGVDDLDRVFAIMCLQEDFTGGVARNGEVDCSCIAI